MDYQEEKEVILTKAYHLVFDVKDLLRPGSREFSNAGTLVEL